MSVDDIRVAVSFKGHRKRKRLKMILGLDAVDYLLDLWISTAQNHPNGKLNNMDEIDIALEAGWDGDAILFTNALKTCGFLDGDNPGEYELHDWQKHQPWVCHADERSERARQAALVRWGNDKDADSMPDACGEHTNGNAPSPLPSPLPKPSPTPENNILGDQEKFHFKKKVPIPKNFHLTDQMRKYAAEKNYNGVEEFTESFIIKNKAKGYQYKNWYAAWQDWLVRDLKDHPEKLIVEMGIL